MCFYHWIISVVEILSLYDEIFLYPLSHWLCSHYVIFKRGIMICNYLITLLLQDVFLRKVCKAQNQNEKNPYSL